MDPSENVAEENSRLRRTMRDLVALSTLPAVWAGLAPDGIARSLADVLLSTLSLDLVYVRLAGRTGEGAVEVVRGGHRADASHVEAVRASLAPLLTSDRTGRPAAIPDPFGAGTLHVAVTRFGVGEDHGVLVAGSRNAGFPTEHDRLLLGVGANQTAIVVQRRRAEELVHEQQEWLRVTLASVGDAVIATDTQGRVTFLNGVAQGLTGWTQEDARGRPLETVFAIVHEQTRRPVENPVEKVLRDGAVVGLANHTVLIARDGTERPIDDSAAPIRDASGRMIGVVLTFRDVTEQRRAEQHRNARLAVTQALSAAASADEGTGGVLRAVCENLAWDVGLFWTADEEGKALACRQSWHGPDAPVGEFAAASRGRTFERGQGLPGRVWASGEPAWVRDVARDANFPRLASAAGHGLHSAFACPVAVGDQTLGVIEFFTRRTRDVDADLLEMMGTVAGNVGQFLERKAAEEEVRRSERELTDFFENATVGLHWVGPDGTILRANRAELEMLGYTREEFVGRPVAEFHADEGVICEILRRLKAGEKLDEYPARLRCKDGSLKDVLIDSSVLWEGGRFVHTRCFTRDVTERKRAEEALRASEQRFVRFMQHLPGLAWIKDQQGRYVYANDAAERAFRTPRAELYGKTDDEVFPPETAAQFRHNDRQAIPSGTGVQVVEALEHEDGVVRYSLVTKFPILESEGQVPLVGGMAIDVTEQRRMEQALRESEERFRGLMEQAPFSIQVFAPDGRTVRVNRAWEGLWGVTFDQIAGYNVLEDRQLEARGVLRYIQQGFAGQPARIPAIQYNPNDTIPDITQHEDPRRWLSAVIYPLKDAGGRVREVVLIHEDITARKRAEDALAESEERFRATLDQAAVGVAHVGLDQRTLWANPGLCSMLGYTEAEMRGRTFLGLTHPDDVDADLAMGRRLLAGEIPSYRIEKRYRHKDGSVVWGDLAVSLVRGASGEPKYVVGVVVDITARKRLEDELRQQAEQLREADRRKDEFLATLAHELRNPLAPISNSLQILKMPRVDAETVERSRDMMERQVHHLVRLVDDLLDVSRVMRGKIELRKERVELATVVARAVETVRPLVDAQRHELSVRLPTESLPIDADPVRLAQVVGNLLANAAKYTEPNGRIGLTAERDGDAVVLRVRDTGIGIAPGVLSHVFELFVQADHATTKAQGGLGIGLTLVKNLVEMHHGTVEAHSEGLGRGSEFVVRLPISARGLDQDQGREAGQQAHQPSSPSGYRLLVVDDNRDAADSLTMLLRLQGHEVRVANSGAAALELTKTYSPDLVFLDLGMPGMDGFEVARRLRQQPGLEKVVLAALTGWGQQEDRRRTAEAGFHHHLVKPPEPTALGSVLAELKSAKG